MKKSIPTVKTWTATVRTLDGQLVARFDVLAPTRFLARLNIPTIYRCDRQVSVTLRRISLTK